MHYDPEGEPITLARWRQLFETTDRSVDESELEVRGEEVTISTDWLGLDHNFLDPEGPPLIFETMVRGGPMDGMVKRYTTREQALAGHLDVVRQHRWWRTLRARKKWGMARTWVQMVKYALTRPASGKFSRACLWIWSVAVLLAVATVCGNLFYTYRWFMLPVHLTTLTVNATMLRWSIVGYRWKRAQQKAMRHRIEQENEFDRIVNNEFRD
jgi:hypothetical protein